MARKGICCNTQWFSLKKEFLRNAGAVSQDEFIA